MPLFRHSSAGERRGVKLSNQMFRMLDDVSIGLGTHGTASTKVEHAGRYRTAQALRRQGFLDGDQLSESGKIELQKTKERNKQ